MQEITIRRMIKFVGEYKARTDDKGRLVFPSAFKALMGSEGAVRLVVKKNLFTPCLDIYTYSEVYLDDWTDPDEPETKPLVPDNMVILMPSNPGFMRAYGACTYLEDGGNWVTAQTNRLLRSFVEHHPDRRMLELQLF